MEYKKEFSRDGNKVTIIFIDDSNFNPIDGCKTKTFSVVKKETIYKKMSEKRKIDLKNKYLENFSMSEYIEKYNPNKNDLMLSSAEGAFFEDVNFSNAKFVGEYVSFSNTIFGKGEVNFSRVEFGDGFVDFLGTQFGDGRVSFNYAKFEKGNIDFSYANFGGGNIFFKRTQFGEGNVDFSQTKFGGGHIVFLQANFGKGNVDFREVRFGDGDVKFTYAKFGDGHVSFLGAIFGDGTIDFSNARFGSGTVDFTHAEFGEGDVNFWGAIFGDGDVGFSNITIKSDWHMNEIVVDNIHFTDSMIHGTIDFKGSTISQLILNGTKLTGKLFVSSKELKLSKKLISTEDAINLQEITTHEEKSYQFRLLKENFRNLGQYDDEDEAYVQFRRNELLHEKNMIQKKWDDTYQKFELKYKSIPTILRKIFRLKKYYDLRFFIFKREIFQEMGLFGTSPLTVAKYMGKTVITFSAIYFLSFLLGQPIISGTPLCGASFVDKFVYSVYHSIVTFLTIGYGDIQPANVIGILFSGMEGFMGLFLMSYFTVAFVRKVLR